MDKRQLAENSWIYYGKGSYCVSVHHPDGVIISTAVGPQIEELADFVIAEGERRLAECGRAAFFVDSYDSPMMTSAFRERMTDWFKRNKGRITVDMLIRSKLLEMALNVANLLIGTGAARAYSDVAKWEAVVRQHVPGFRRKPIPIPDECTNLRK